MRIRTPLILTSLCAAALLAVAGFADTLAEIVAFADTNHDGEVDRAEFQRRQKDVFFFSDADKNGRLSASELGTGEAAEVLELADRNRDGELELDEFLDLRARAFSRADTNKDGALSLGSV